MKKLFIDILLFVKTGNPNKSELKLTKGGIFFGTFLLDIVLGILFAFLISLFLPFIIDTEPAKSHAAEGINNGLIPVFVILIIAPLVEEISYRLFLKFTPLNLALSFAFISYFVLSLTTKTEYYIINFSALYILLICIGVFVISFLLIKKKQEIITQFYNSRFRLILYFSILLFAYSHLTNYPIETVVLILSPILIFPQIISGILYSYIRLKLGFMLGVILHISKNLLFNLHLLSTL